MNRNNIYGHQSVDVHIYECSYLEELLYFNIQLNICIYFFSNVWQRIYDTRTIFGRYKSCFVNSSFGICLVFIANHHFLDQKCIHDNPGRYFKNYFYLLVFFLKFFSHGSSRVQIKCVGNLPCLNIILV